VYGTFKVRAMKTNVDVVNNNDLVTNPNISIHCYVTLSIKIIVVVS